MIVAHSGIGSSLPANAPAASSTAVRRASTYRQAPFKRRRVDNGNADIVEIHTQQSTGYGVQFVRHLWLAVERSPDLFSSSRTGRMRTDLPKSIRQNISHKIVNMQSGPV